jgi:hypothetical protein
MMKAMRWVFACVVIAMSSAAGADPKADQLFIEGRELLKAGKAKEACEKFHAANAIDEKAPAVLLNLGLCYDALHKTATSLKWLRKAQNAASEANPRATDYENAAAEKKAKLTPLVATVRINAGTVAEGVEILVDGTRQGREELVVPVEIDAGTHAIEARSPGKTSYVETITVKDGDHVDAKAIPALADAPKTPTPVSDSHRKRNGLLISAGSGVVLVGVLVTNVLFKSQNDRTGSIESGTRDTYKNIQIFALTPLAVAGFVGLGYGGYLFFSKGKGAEQREARIVPAVTPDGFGVTAFGHF